MKIFFPVPVCLRTGIHVILINLLAVTADAQSSPYPPSETIRDIQFDWSSHMRLATGSDNWPITWAADNNQYAVWGDGGGFGGTNSIGRSSLGVARIEGDWHDFKAANVWGGYKGENAHHLTGKSYGLLSVDGTLYMWVGMFRTKSDQFDNVRLAYSSDYGASWKFCPWGFTSEEGVMMPTVCNYGKNYKGATDQYVYTYLIRFRSYEGPDDYPDKVDWLNCQKPGTIDLARVPKDKILDRDAYTFYAGTSVDGPQWTKEIGKRKPVFEDPEGVGWCMSVSYNAGLRRYLLTTEHTETHRGNIGIFDAPNPWGPWTTVCYQKQWGKGHFPLNTFFWNFSNKWLSDDGKTFTLIFTGRKENDSFNLVRGKFITHE